MRVLGRCWLCPWTVRTVADRLPVRMAAHITACHGRGRY